MERKIETKIKSRASFYARGCSGEVITRNLYGADNTPEVEPPRGHLAGERALRTAVPYREGPTEMRGMW